MLSCQDTTKLISESLDRPLSARIRFGVWLHLLICKWCDRFRRQVLFIRTALRRAAAQLETQDFPALPPLSSEARERLKQALRRQQKP
jgi:hypothetical protein